MEQFKFICPICGGVLKPYTPLLDFPFSRSYCPNCEVVRISFGSFYLCENCHSPALIHPKEGSRYKGSEYEGKCWYCNGEMRIFKKEELEKYKKEGKLKEGYFLSQSPRKEKCEHMPKPVLKRHTKTVYKSSCAFCGEDLYIYVPKWQQEEIRENRGKSGKNISLDEITIDEIYETEKERIQVVTFENEKDLIEKVKKVMESLHERFKKKP